jgi:hypothetical protein
MITLRSVRRPLLPLDVAPGRTPRAYLYLPASRTRVSGALVGRPSVSFSSIIMSSFARGSAASENPRIGLLWLAGLQRLKRH